MATAPTSRPNWDQLFDTALSQEGLFTTHQAADAGYSPQLLVHYLHTGRATRPVRGVYRLVHFPAGEHEDLVAAWLWSDRVGVLSHQTALALHDLSDVLPSKIHLTVPTEWKKRRLKVPVGVVLHYADVPQHERAWFGAVPITNPIRTIVDCASDHLSDDLLQQAVQQASRRGLATSAELSAVGSAFA